MRLRPENLFYKKERCIDAFFQKKKEEIKKKHSESRKRSPPCRLDRHGFKTRVKKIPYR